MRISEEFYSIQGESSFSGKPCYFIRVHGCSLRCTYCDSTYATLGNDFKEVHAKQILVRALQSPAPIVEITGGEPLLQEDEVLFLCRNLVKHKEAVLVETNGAHHLRPFVIGAPDNFRFIVDIKCPSSGMTGKMVWENLETEVQKHCEYKFVVGDDNDLDFVKQVLQKFPLRSAREVIISPVYRKMPLKKLARWVLKNAPQMRLQIQLHKLIWGATRRGV